MIIFNVKKKLLIVNMLIFSSFTINSSLAFNGLDIENFITPKNNVRLSISSTYSNATNVETISTGHSELIIGDNQTLQVSHPIKTFYINTDSFNTGLSLKYGVTNKLDFGIAGLYLKHTARINSENTFFNKSNDYLKKVELNAKYQIIDSNDILPDTIIFSNLYLFDNEPRLKSFLIPSFSSGITTYTITDPILISLTAEYLHMRDRIGINNEKFNFGDLISITPSISFIANNQITLNGAINFQLKRQDYINDKIVHSIRSSTNLIFGVNYQINERNYLNSSIKTNISGLRESNFTLELISKIGKLPPTVSEIFKQQ